jgi:YVTN family beta-propeller protein
MTTRHIAVLLALASPLVAGCSDTTGPHPCPNTGPVGPALASTGRWLLVAHGLSEDWMALDLTADPPAPTCERGLTGVAPNDLDVSGSRLAVVNSGDNTIGVVSLATGKLLGTIPVGTGTNPWELTVDPADSTRAWVTTFVSGEVVEVDLGTLAVVRRAAVGAAAEGILVAGDRIAVTLTGFNLTTYGYDQGYVVVLDKSTLAEVARLPVPTNPQKLVRGGDGRIDVVCTGDYAAVPGRVVRVESDWSAVRDTLTLGGTPDHALLAGGNTVYVVGYAGGVMSYDSNAFALLHGANDPVVAGTGFTALAASGGRLYAANFDADAVTVIDLASGSSLGSVAVSDGPSALTVYP